MLLKEESILLLAGAKTNDPCILAGIFRRLCSCSPTAVPNKDQALHTVMSANNGDKEDAKPSIANIFNFDFDDENFDFENFEDEEPFDLSGTLNSIINGIDIPEDATSDEEMEIYNKELNGIILKMQYQIEDLSEKAEETMKQMVLSIPTLDRSLTKMEKEGAQLKKELGKVIEEMNTLENGKSKEDDEVIDQLLRLDIVKRNMTSVAEKLTQSESWDKNVREMDEALNAGDLRKAAEQCQTLKNAMPTLQDLPLAEERETTLNKLQNTLQSQLSPKIERVLNNDSSEDFEYYVNVYTTLGGKEELRNMYANHMSKILRSKWDIYDSNADKDFANWLSPFFESIVGYLYAEMSRCLKFFAEDILAIVCQVLRNIFEPIEQSFVKRLESSVYSMKNFLDAYRVTTYFVSAIELLVDTISKKLKADKSSAAKLSSLASMDVELENTLYFVFKPFEQTFQQYGEFVVEDLKAETTKLLKIRNIEVNFENSWDILQHIRNVAAVMASVILTIDESLDSTMDVTQGTVLESFSNAVGLVMKDFLSFQNKIRDQIRSMVRLDDIFERNASKSKEKHFDSPEDRFWEVLELCVRLLAFNSTILEQWQKYHLSSREKVITGTVGLLSLDENNGVSERQVTAYRALGKKSKEELEASKGARVKVNGLYVQESQQALVNISRGLAAIRLRKNNALKVAVTSLVTKLKQNEIKMFPDVFAYIGSNIERNLRLMYEITIAPIKFYLRDVQKYKLWSKLESSNADNSNGGEVAEDFQGINSRTPFNSSGVTGAIGDKAPSYGGPFEYATLIGESLLSLVQRLEQFQDFDPFQTDAVSVEDIQAIVKNDWKNLMTELGLDEDDLFQDKSSDEWDHFSKAWVAVSASGAMALFVNTILSIRFISDIGAQQLVLDISYMLNVLSALGVQAGKLMEPLKKIFEMNIDELTALANAEDTKGDQGDESSFGNRKLVLRIAKQRGIMTSSF